MRECQQLWLQVTEAGAGRAVFITMLHLLSYEADRSAVFLTCAVADVVVLRSEGFYFFISFIMFLFLSSLVVSQFRQEEWLPGGPCSGTGTCMMCVVHGRAVHTEVKSVGCSVETPYSEER